MQSCLRSSEIFFCVVLLSLSLQLLSRCGEANGALPDTVVYYRDGVSDGQLFPVLPLELNYLAEAFRNAGGRTYDPRLVIVVGQKRHPMRFWLDDGWQLITFRQGRLLTTASLRFPT